MSLLRWDLLIFCIIFTALGAGAGWMAAHQAEGADDHAHEDHHDHDEGHDEAGHAHDEDDHGPEFAPQTLRNMGVTTGTVELTSFTRYREIPAVIESITASSRPVFAPVGGRISTVEVESGMMVDAGQVLVTLVRDPIPRPKLALTATIIKPAREEIHGAMVELRKSGAEVEILQTEIHRVRRFTGQENKSDLPLIPREKLIELGYQLTRMQKAHEQARHELIKHGFSEKQIEEMATGDHIANLDRENWLRALVQNGLWTEDADKLFATLPESQKKDRWVIATVGELDAAGLIHADLIRWLEGQKERFPKLIEIGALLQEGYSVAKLTMLHEQGAFDPIVKIRAPGPESSPDWDVSAVMIRPGARVEAGDRLLDLRNPRAMYLRADPVGVEQTDVLTSLAASSVCEAVPLVKDAGPGLKDLTIAFVKSGSAMKGTAAFCRVANEALTINKNAEGGGFRSWKLREGLRYLLRVPQQKVDGVFVLPRGAVTEDGPDRIVFIPDGDSFKSLIVEVAYEDDEVVVIPVNKDTELFAGDVVVSSGAYALGLAMHAGSNEIDPHAGHSH